MLWSPALATICRCVKPRPVSSDCCKSSRADITDSRAEASLVRLTVSFTESLPLPSNPSLRSFSSSVSNGWKPHGMSTRALCGSGRSRLTISPYPSPPTNSTAWNSFGGGASRNCTGSSTMPIVFCCIPFLFLVCATFICFSVARTSVSSTSTPAYSAPLPRALLPPFGVWWTTPTAPLVPSRTSLSIATTRPIPSCPAEFSLNLSIQFRI
ncbi:hypothetical protein [Salmonella phage SE40]|nr:hypothetical protein [Salmonella phage SE40]